MGACDRLVLRALGVVEVLKVQLLLEAPGVVEVPRVSVLASAPGACCVLALYVLWRPPGFLRCPRTAFSWRWRRESLKTGRSDTDPAFFLVSADEIALVLQSMT